MLVDMNFQGMKLYSWNIGPGDETIPYIYIYICISILYLVNLKYYELFEV